MKMNIKKTDKILLSVLLGACGAVVAAELIDDEILIRIWYAICGIVCGIIVYIWMTAHSKSKEQLFTGTAKAGDVADIIIKRDLVKKVDELIGHVEKIDELSTHVGKIDEDLQSIQSLLMGNIAEVLDEDSRERMSVVSGQVQRIRPKLNAVIGAKPFKVQKPTPTTIHEEPVTPVKPYKPAPVIPQIKPIVNHPSDDISPEELARVDGMIAKPVNPAKPVVTLVRPRTVKPATPQNVDHYDDPVTVDEDPDSEE